MCQIFSLSVTASDKKEQPEYVKVMIDKGIISEDENLDASLNRQNVALYLAKLMTMKTDSDEWTKYDGKTEIGGVKGAPYEGALMYMVDNKIVSVDGGLIDTSSPITYQDALTFILRAIGYTELSYPWGYIEKAQELKINTEIKNLGYSDNITKDGFIQLLYKAFPMETAIKFTTTKLTGYKFDLGYSKEGLAYVKWGDAGYTLLNLVNEKQTKVDGNTVTYYTYSELTPPREFRGGDVQIIAFSDLVNVFSIPDMELTSLDVSKLSNLKLFNADNNKIEAPVNTDPEYVMPFTDITETHWAYDYVKQVAALGIMTGMSEDEFSPEAPMTREMFVSSLAKAANIETDPVEWAQSQEILLGGADGDLMLENSITREQMAVMFERYFKASKITPDTTKAITDTFADSSEVASWASDAVELMRETGLIGGKANKMFDPQGTFTRAEAAAVLYRLLDIIK